MFKRPCLALLFLLAGCATPALRGGDEPVAGGRRAETEALLRGAVAENPNDAESHFNLAQLLADDLRPVEAVEHYEAAERLQARFKPRVSEERRRHLRTYVEHAKRLIDEARYADADKLLAGAEVLVPGDPEALFLRGRSLSGQGDAAGAVDALRLAARKDPGSRDKQSALAGALLALAQARYEGGKPAESWDLLEEARRADPGADLSYVQGTVAYALAQSAPEGDRGRYLDAAAEAFNGHLARHPDDTDARFNLGAVLLASQRYGEAVATYMDLIAADPRDGDLYMVLSRAHSFSGQPEMAAVEEAIGHALRGGEPVSNPADWARRAAARFPRSDLATAYVERLAPEAIHTYSLPGGALVEVWFYWNAGKVLAFREGGELGPAFDLPRR